MFVKVNNKFEINHHDFSLNIFKLNRITGIINNNNKNGIYAATVCIVNL